MNYKYIEIRERKTQDVLVRMDVTNESDKRKNLILMGALRNLYVEKYYADEFEYETDQPKIGK